MVFIFEVAGTAADDQTWTVAGSGELASPGGFSSLPHMVFELALQKLTGGKAVYGKPGVGCRGPYHMTRLVIEIMQ